MPARDGRPAAVGNFSRSCSSTVRGAAAVRSELLGAVDDGLTHVAPPLRATELAGLGSDSPSDQAL